MLLIQNNGDEENTLLHLLRQTEKRNSHVTFLGSSNSAYPSSRSEPVFNAVILNLWAFCMFPSWLCPGKLQLDIVVAYARQRLCLILKFYLSRKWGTNTLHYSLLLWLSVQISSLWCFNSLWAFLLIRTLFKFMNIDNTAGFFLFMPGVHSSRVIHEFPVKWFSEAPTVHFHKLKKNK